MTLYDTDERVMREQLQQEDVLATLPAPQAQQHGAGQPPALPFNPKTFIARKADLEGVQRRLADSVSVSPAAMARMAADLSTVVEQGRQTNARLNEELGALGVQLRQQHMDMSDRIMSLQQGIGSQFDAMAAAIAASSSQVSRMSDAVAQRQQALVCDMVQKELALQLLPIRARARVTTALCGASVAVSCALLALMLLA